MNQHAKRNLRLATVVAGLFLCALPAASGGAEATTPKGPGGDGPPTLRRIAADADYVPSRASRERWPSPGPAPLAPGEAVAPVTGKSVRYIRVHGRVVFDAGVPSTAWLNGHGLDGATVHVHDTHLILDVTLGTTVSDPDGWFDVTVACEASLGDPDIHLEFTSENDRIRVEGAAHEIRRLNTETFHDVSGSDLDVGTVEPYDYDDIRDFVDLIELTRDWRWLALRGYDCPFLTSTLDPLMDGGAVYQPTPTSGLIRQGAALSDDLGRLYGLHFLRGSGALPGSRGYCNPGDYHDYNGCDLANWCPENENVAWADGFGLWFYRQVAEDMFDTYGVHPYGNHSFETPAKCTEDADFWADRLLTPGFTAAVLTDISDDTQDIHELYADPAAFGPPADDVLAMGPGPILTCIDLDGPRSTGEFLDSFRQRFAGSAPELWRTARNCGWQIDSDRPQPAPNLGSTSHEPATWSPDPTVDFEWSLPADDASGVYGYGITISTTGPELPPEVMNLGAVTEYTTPILGPGIYWFNLRPVDGAGHWCLTSSNFGPVYIRDSEPSNLAFEHLPGWAGPVVPSSLSYNTPGSCPAPLTLSGGEYPTYWNCSAYNTNETATSTDFVTGLQVDGQDAWPWGYGIPLPGYTSFQGNNLGPVNVRGGRHVFAARLDATDRIAETDEHDNLWGRQWAWSGEHLYPNLPATRGAPPLPLGGWDAVTDGSTLAFNCDGLRIPANYGAYDSGWRAVVVRAANRDDDYDLRLYQPTPDLNLGYTTVLAASAAGPGYADVVLVNAHVLQPDYGLYWDAGVVNMSAGTGDYNVMCVTGSGTNLGTPIVLTLDDAHPLALVECFVGSYDAAAVTAFATTPSTRRDVTLLWFDGAAAAAGLQDAAGALRVDETGRARIDRANVGAGYHCLAVLRNPRDGTGGTVAVTVKLMITPPDLTPATPDGWACPLVPRAAPDGTAASCPAPVTLPGNASSTWLNFAIRNDSDLPAPAFDAMLRLDGGAPAVVPLAPLAAHATGTVNWSQAQTLTGGRHTLSLRLDENLRVDEGSETNNAFGRQWVWSPLTVPAGTQVTRNGPPAPTGGWEDCQGDEPLYYNCDGLRMRVDNTQASYCGLALTSPTAYDLDLRVSSAVGQDASHGFGSTPAWSQWSAYQTDFVLANGTVSDGRDYDVAVVRDDGTHETIYTAEAVQSVRVPQNADGRYGQYLFAGGHLLDLKEFYLTPGQWAFRLDNLFGVVDWGISLYAPGVECLGKSDIVPGGIAFSRGAGQAEWFTVDAPAEGWYCLAIWRVSSSTLATEGRYRLRIVPNVSAVDDLPPAPIAATAIESIHPSPCNPQATVTFSLAAAGRARVEVYDLHGAKVRTLLDADLPAGRRAATWDGCGDAGLPVGSGVYMVLLSAGDARDMKKVVLLR